MAKLLQTIGATVGGSVGWWLGARIGLFTAMMLSVVGTAAGVYWVSRFVRAHL